MARYSSISTLSNVEVRQYVTVKYPEISRGFEDIYVYTTQGDRYDILALTYYGDSSLWWVISSSNPTYVQDSIIPPIGIQIRIPSSKRIPNILGQYEVLNNI